MQRSLTWFLLAAALAMFGAILVLERNVPGTKEREAPGPLFPTVDWQEASAIRISYASGETLSAEKTNDVWTLRNPAYPAQQASVENFLSNLASIKRMDRLAPHEIALQGAKYFGLEPPRAKIEITAGTNHLSFEVGGRAPLTNNFYLRLPSSGEVILASGQVAELLPPSLLAWRDPRIVNLANLDYDRIRLRNGQRTLELARDPTNRLWKITRPVPARANQQRVLGLVDALRNANVWGYVADAPPDLERFALQNPEGEVTLLQGTNRLYSIELGGPLANNTNLLSARLLGNSNVVAVTRQLGDFLRQPHRNFNETQLISVRPAALDRILINSTEHFALQRESDRRWNATLEGRSFPVDPALLARFLTNVLTLEILDIAKEVPTDVDLKTFGLLNPRVSISFFERLTSSNAVLTNIMFNEISFGTNQSDRVLARRADEVPVYYVPLAQLLVLPDEAFEFRDRRIWTIPATNITRISLSNGAGTNALERGPNGAWSADPIANEAISEAVLRLATLDAVEWTSRGEPRKRALGIRENPLTLTVETKERAYTVQFGTETMQRNLYAATDLPGEDLPVLFQFPGLLFYSLVELLPVPK